MGGGGTLGRAAEVARRETTTSGSSSIVQCLSAALCTLILILRTRLIPPSLAINHKHRAGQQVLGVEEDAYPSLAPQIVISIGLLGELSKLAEVRKPAPLLFSCSIAVLVKCFPVNPQS